MPDFKDLSKVNKFIPAAKQKIQSARRKTTPATAMMKFPTAERIAYGMYFKFNKVEYKIDANTAGAKFSNLGSGAHIFLPLPKNAIVENLGITYQSQDVGALMHLINVGATGAMMLKDNLSGEATNAGNIQTAMKMAGDLAGTASVIGRTALNSVAPGAGAMYDMQSQTVVNPYTLALFQSVASRAHNFTFMLVPQNAEDSKMIQEIVRQFQYHSLPGKKPGGFFLTMPSEVEMAFYGTDKLFKFAPCFINNVSVNYSPFGTNSFFGLDGAPTGVELTLNFQEIESLTRESYEADGTKDAFGAGGNSI